MRRHIGSPEDRNVKIGMLKNIDCASRKPTCGIGLLSLCVWWKNQVACHPILTTNDVRIFFLYYKNELRCCRFFLPRCEAGPAKLRLVTLDARGYACH